MGCCASSVNKSPPPPPSSNHQRRHSRSGSRAPPPTFLEEETVKEVLSSETPNLKSISTIHDDDDDDDQGITHNNINKHPNKWVLCTTKVNGQDDDDDSGIVDKKPLTTDHDTSDYSEICSLNDAVSTVADDCELSQRLNRSPAKFRNRSFSGDLSTRRDKMVGGKSPARRLDPSPGRVRLVPSRERRGLLTDGPRREAGDKSGRRSRSPATRVDGEGPRPGLGRSSSSRRTGKSPGRVGSEVCDKNRTNREEKWPPTGNGNESLENPLVSLECFIFL